MFWLYPVPISSSALVSQSHICRSMQKSDRPSTLEKVLNKLESLNSVSQRKILFQTDLRLITSETKAIKDFQGNFQNILAFSSRGNLRFGELSNLDKSTGTQTIKLP